MQGNKTIESVARERFAFAALRPGQREGIEAVLDGHDALVVMPTGSGKSAVYEIAGELIPGSTIVVSPLIALQRDQVESIDAGQANEAAELNSTLTERQREETLEEVEEGELEFLFSRRSSSRTRRRSPGSERRRSRCSSSTRRTASANGDTTSAPTTCGSAP